MFRSAERIFSSAEHIFSSAEHVFSSAEYKPNAVCCTFILGFCKYLHDCFYTFTTINQIAYL